MATAGADDKFLSNWTVYSASGLIRAFVKPAHADAAGEMAGVDPVPYAANQRARGDRALEEATAVSPFYAYSSFRDNWNERSTAPVLR